MAARLTKSFRALPSFRPFIRTISTRDPFPLPLSPEVTDARRFSETETPLPPRTLRENETIAAMRSRLVYQSRKRGMLEGDLLLSTFATENLSSMSEKELIEYDRLLDEPDWDIYYWAINKKEPPERWKESALLERLRQHARNEGKVVRKMPELH